jgi:hypothetical protein
VHYASIEIKIKPLKIEDLASPHARMQGHSHDVFQLGIVSHRPEQSLLLVFC